MTTGLTVDADAGELRHLSFAGGEAAVATASVHAAIAGVEAHMPNEVLEALDNIAVTFPGDDNGSEKTSISLRVDACVRVGADRQGDVGFKTPIGSITVGDGTTFFSEEIQEHIEAMLPPQML